MTLSELCKFNNNFIIEVIGKRGVVLDSTVLRMFLIFYPSCLIHEAGKVLETSIIRTTVEVEQLITLYNSHVPLVKIV